MKILILLLSLSLCPLAFGQSCNNVSVVTGVGYLKNSKGQVTAYTSYPVGKVCIPTGFTYTEVANQAALSAIPLYIHPLTAQEQQNELIREDEQALAIADLQNKGILTAAQASTLTSNLTVLSSAKKTKS